MRCQHCTMNANTLRQTSTYLSCKCAPCSGCEVTHLRAALQSSFINFLTATFSLGCCNSISTKQYQISMRWGLPNALVSMPALAQQWHMSSHSWTTFKLSNHGIRYVTYFNKQCFQVDHSKHFRLWRIMQQSNVRHSNGKTLTLTIILPLHMYTWTTNSTIEPNIFPTTF